MKFSNCGQTCGQRRFLTIYRRGEKCCQPKCPKAFRVFRGLWLEPKPHAPKSRALPTALHPDIQFFCMIPCGEGKSKFFVSVGGAVVTPDFARVFQPGNFRRKLLAQGLPESRIQRNGWVVYPPKSRALPTALHPVIDISPARARSSTHVRQCAGQSAALAL